MASIRKIDGRKSKPWRVDIRKSGKAPITETFRTKKEAHEFAAKIEANFGKWSRLLRTEMKRNTLADLIDKFIEQWQGKDPTVLSRAAWWKDNYGDTPLADNDDDVIREGLALLEATPAQQGGRKTTGTDRQRSPATVNRYKTAISTVYKTAIDKGWYGIKDNPCTGIRQRKENNSRFGKCLGDDQRTTLLGACDASAWAGLGVFVRMALATGARRGELLKLEWSDVDLETGSVLFLDTKNADDRRVPLIGEAKDRLKAWAEAAGETGLVFPHPTKPDKSPPIDWYWQQARKSAGLEGIRLHDLRHSVGTFLARSGASAFQIAAILGHRSGPTLTQRYVHLVAEESRDVMEDALSGITEKDDG